MADIPLEIIWKILARLPAETLLRLRSVCKEWLRIIGESSFIKDHTHNQLRSHCHTLLLRDRRKTAPLYSFSLDSLNFISGHQMIDATRINQTIRRRRRLLPRLFGATFCNGLILVPTENVWAICNPLTRDFHELPNLPKPNVAAWRLSSLGLGYDYVSDDYKVVRIDKFYDSATIRYQTLIYSLKSGSWRKIENFPCCPEVQWLTVFLNGTLYWKSEVAIIALDLETETYSQLPLPPVDRAEIRRMITYDNSRFEYDNFHLNSLDGCYFHLDSLDGCLVCSLNYWRPHLRDSLLEGWVMKDGVEKTWVKLFSRQYVFKKPKLVAYLKRKEQVVLQHDWGFLWLDIGNNSAKKFSIYGLPDITSSHIFQGSLVRLDGRDLSSKRKRMAKRADRRLKFCVRNVGEKCCPDNESCSEDDLCKCCSDNKFYSEHDLCKCCSEYKSCSEDLCRLCKEE